MVRVPRLGRIDPRRLTLRWRARLRAQRRWWRERWRASATGDLLFPPDGRGMVAVETLARATADAASGPRVAILHANAGSGHKRAAEAIAAAIARLSAESTVREVDTLVFASRFYRGTYAATYNQMAARAPRLWGALYHSWAMAPVNRSTAPLRLALDRMNLRRLVRVVERESPDAVVCTHFLPVEALSPGRGRGNRVPLYCVITDFAAHPFWAFPQVDRYFVASAAVADELAGHGVARDRIEVTGIPIDPRFAEHIGRDVARARFGLDVARPVILVMGGGRGVGPLVELASRLSGISPEPQLVVVCGTNSRMRDEVDRLPAARTGRMRTLGFTDEVDVLLEACDVMVSKAGGLTCSEALAKGVPTVIFKPTPGQEVRNAQYLESGGAAIHADTIDAVEAEVTRLILDPQANRAMRTAAQRLAAPHAAVEIARRVLANAGADELSA